MKCMFCGAPATLYCDGLLGYLAKQNPDDPEDKRQYIDIEHRYTCDAPMCGTCATNKGRYFFDGRVRFMDTVDFCPICEADSKAGEQSPKDRLFSDLTAVTIFRKAHYARVRNVGLKKLELHQGGGQGVLDF